MKKPTAFPFRPAFVIAASCALAPLAQANDALWTGLINSSASTNWSDLANWSNTGTGGSGPFQNSARFTDATGVGDAFTINNVVNDNESPFSLTYTNQTTFQNTLILPGQTLRVYTGGVTMGNTTALANTINPVTTISGLGGTLVVSNGNVTVGQSFSSTSGSGTTLDLSSLDTFVGTNVARLLIGQGSTRMSGKLYLARTNYLNFTGAAPQLDIGDNSGNNGPGSAVYLGQNSVILVDSIAMGLAKQNSGGGGKLLFNPALVGSNPTALIRGTNGPNSAVSTWAIADGGAASGTITDSGTTDFSGGTVNALVNAMWVGRNSTKANAGTAQNTGTLTLDTGVISVNNLTNAMLASSAQSPTVNGTINVNGTALLTVNSNLVLGAMNGFIGTVNSTLNINGGTVQANNLICGGGLNNNLNVTSGTLVLSNSLIASAGALASVSLTTATLRLAVDGLTTNLLTGSLMLGDEGTVIHISALPVLSGYPSYFPLIGYVSFSGGNPTLGTLPSTYQGYVSNDFAGTIWLAVTNGPATAKADEWIGNVNNAWDTTSLNWKSGAVAVKYAEQDSVTFDDLGQSTTVNLTGTRSPSGLTVNSSLNYVFSGTGSLTGPVRLVKQGSGSLTLSETGGDSFRGGIDVAGGRLVLDNAASAISGGLTVDSGATAQIGNNDTNGGLPAGPVQVDGTLAFARTDNVVVDTAIAGNGSLTQSGSGVLTLSASNSFSGNVTVSSGTLALSGAGSLAGSAQVTVNHATLDLTAVSGTASLNALSLANAGLSVNADYVRPLVNVTSLSASGANTINVATLPGIANYPSTIPLLQSASPIGGGSFVTGSFPAATPPYSGTLSLSADGTTLLLTLTSGPVGVRPYVSWSGADAATNPNWSDGQNWQLPGSPSAADYVIFSDTASAFGSPFSAVGAGPGGVVNAVNFNNVVVANTTISYLNYSNVASSFQNTLLGNGVTLNVLSTNTSPRVFTVGSAATDFGTTAQGFVTIGGSAGTLNVNNTNGTFYVGLGSGSSGSSSQATLDMSGLGACTATLSRLFIGAGGNSVGIGISRASGAVYLARTNLLTLSGAVSGTETSDTSASATALDVGDNNNNGGPQSSLYLGQTNAIFADAICTARQKQNAQMLFNPAFSSPAAYFRGQDGVSRVGTWSLADGVVNTGTSTSTGVNDFTGGYVNALVNTMYVGRGANTTTGSGTSSGTLSFDNGLFDVNTLYLGYQPASGTKIGVGTLNVGAAARLVVNGTLNIGLAAGGGGAASTVGTLNINGGTVQANTLVAGSNGGTSSLSLNGGTLIITNTAGTPAAPLTVLNLTGGTLQLNLNGSAGVANLVASTINPSGTTLLKIAAINNVMAGVTYPLISYTGVDPFSSLSLAALPTGYVGSLVDDAANGIIGLNFTKVQLPKPFVTGLSLSGTTLNLSATNGAPNGRFVLLGSTNVALPLSQWTPVLTNTFDASGNLNLSTNVINPALKQQFYLLSQ